jgi:hypothetical protein
MSRLKVKSPNLFTQGKPGRPPGPFVRGTVSGRGKLHYITLGDTLR